jgi:hypothetical protein
MLLVKLNMPMEALFQAVSRDKKYWVFTFTITEICTNEQS